MFKEILSASVKPVITFTALTVVTGIGGNLVVNRFRKALIRDTIEEQMELIQERKAFTKTQD